MNWISVNDKLPNHLDTVLAYGGDRAYFVVIFIITELVEKFLIEKNLQFKKKEISNIPNYSFCSREINGNVLKNVTHWMPLPEPPKKDHSND